MTTSAAIPRIPVPPSFRRATVENVLPPSLPAPRLVAPLFGGLYAVAYGIGGQPLVRRLVQNYGPVVALPVLGYGSVVAVADPALAKQVFTAKPDVLLGGEGVGPAAAIYGRRSMFVLEEPEHLRRRKMVTPALHGKTLNAYVPIIEDAMRGAMASWPDGSPVRMLDAARELTLDVIVQVLFGAQSPTEIARLGRPFAKLLDLALSIETPIRYAARRLGALRSWTALAEVNREIDDLMVPLITERRSRGHRTGPTDILGMLVDARSEDGVGLTDKEIRADVITLMLAGHETTATTLAWAADLLAHHPAAQERIRAEADGGHAAYTEAVINETLRLHPPAPITGRMTAEQYQLGDYTLPAGTRIVLLLDLINRDVRTYPEPDTFRPERFLTTRPSPYGWVPFGGGLKRCIGAAFSMCELRTMLHTLLRGAELRPVSTRQESPSSRGAPVIVPSDGARVYVAALSRQP